MTNKEFEKIYGTTLGIICLIFSFIGLFVALCAAGYHVSEPSVQWRWPVFWIVGSGAAMLLVLPPINCAIVKLRAAEDSDLRGLKRSDRKRLRAAKSTAKRMEIERRLEKAAGLD